MKTTISMFTILAAGTLLASAAVTPSGDSGLRSYLSDGSDREIEISSNLTIDLSYTDTKILEVNQTNTLTSSGTDVFTITGPTDGYFSITTSSSLTLSNITFSTFNLTESSYDYGAFLNAGTLTLNSSATLTSNSASGNGAAVFNSGTLNLNEGSTISNNSATNGGAIYNNGTTTSDGVKTITIAGTENAKTTIFGNSATNGGAIYNEVYGKISVSGNVEFSGNSASGNGGAIYNVGDGSSTDVSVSATFSKNTATSEGGAIYNSGTMTIAGTFSENSASDGGAIYNTNTISSLSGKFTGNKATNGGAIYNYSGTISNLSGKFTNNTATSQGGAIFNRGTITIVGNTEFTGNTSNIGSNAIFNSLGTIKLNPGENETITFNDGISGSASTSATIELLESAAGTVYFNNKVENNTINVRGGTLVFGTFAGDTELGVAASSGSIGDNAALNIYGGLVDVGTLSLSNFTLNGGEITGTNYTIDSTGTLTAGTIAGGIANVSGISSESTGTLNLSATTVKSSGNVSFAGTLNLSGTLEFTGTSATMLSAGTLNLTGTIKLADSQALTISATTFLARGNAKISGGEIVSAITLTKDQVLTLEDTKVSGAIAVNSGATLYLNPGENGTIEIAGGITNSASATNGEIYISGDSTGTVKINSAVQYASVTLNSGTLVLDENFSQLNSHFSIYGGTISGAKASSLTGSAVTLKDDAAVTVENATLSETFKSNNFTSVGTNVSYTLENVTAKNLDSGAVNHNQSIALSIINGTFTGNSVSSISAGGAITNSGQTIKILTGTFSGNKAVNSYNSEAGNGGAIYNTGTIEKLAGTFENNTAGANGGAIYNTGTITIVADSTISTSFSGNTVGSEGNKTSNAIYNTGTIYMNVDGSENPETYTTGSITFDDAISGSNGKIYVNASTDASGNAISAGTDGMVYFNGEVSGNTVYLCGGVISVGAQGSISNLVVDGNALDSDKLWETSVDDWDPTITNTYYVGPKVDLVGSLGTVKLENEATVSISGTGTYESIEVGAGSTLLLGGGDFRDITITTTGTIVVNNISAFVDGSYDEGEGDFGSGTEEITVTELTGVEVVAIWTFDITNSENAEVTVSTTIETGLDAGNLVIFHLADDAESWENYTKNVKLKYDSATGEVSFTTTNFCSYMIATIPEPSMFGVIAGTLALLLAGTRRRRK